VTRIRTAKDMGVKMDIIAAEDERTCQAARTYDGKAFKPDEVPGWCPLGQRRSIALEHIAVIRNITVACNSIVPIFRL
jgi:hypothetical protein